MGWVEEEVEVNDDEDPERFFCVTGCVTTACGPKRGGRDCVDEISRATNMDTRRRRRLVQNGTGNGRVQVPESLREEGAV
jgi:hypothetical protein